MQKAPGTFDPVAEPDGDSPAASDKGPGGPPEAPAVRSASHEILFQACEPEACDACGGALPEYGDDEGYELPGSAVYMWTRGDSVRFEKAPLCATCAAAIGAAALSRWEIEEEEG